MGMSISKLFRRTVKTEVKPPPPSTPRPAQTLRREDTFTTARRAPVDLGGSPRAAPRLLALGAQPAPKFDEEKAPQVLSHLYRSLLGREPDPSGAGAYLPLLAEGKLSTVVDALVLSPEFAARAAHGDPEKLTAELYRAILKREPDPEGAAATVSAIRAGLLAHRTFDMVVSPEATALREAPPPGPGPSERQRRTGAVRASGTSFEDDQGKFNALGATLMSAAWKFKNDRAGLERELETLASNGFDYIRALGVVGHPSEPDYWDGREIDWRDPEYAEVISGLTDLAWDKYGLRVQWTLIGDGQLNIPSEADRFRLADRFLEMSKGREQKIMFFELANEAWQNGFAGDDGAEQLRRLTKYLNDRTDILVASSAPPGGTPEDTRAYYEGGVADIGTFHFDRDISKTEGHWRPVRQPWEYKFDPNLPKLGVNNEPIGPGASVSSENDPKRLVAGAIASYVSGLPGYVFHSRAGVRGDQSFSEMPGVEAFRNLKKFVPPDLASWNHKNAHWADSPFKVYARDGEGRLHADKMWTDERGMTGAVRAYGAVKGDEFFVFPMGLNGPLVMEPRRDAEFDVIDPMTGEVLEHKRLKAGERFELSGDVMFVLKGRYV